ncbi:MAG: Rrf2 family transcriptional regulator, partial [Spirochaetales bacterium]
MFAVSSRVRYALRALSLLAGGCGPLGSKEIVSLHSIADREGISRKYREQIFNPLKKSGIVTGSRGPEGGYTLARSPVEITLYDIVTALEGPVLTAQCSNHNDDCIRSGRCSSQALWEELQDVTVSFLKARTLEQ